MLQTHFNRYVGIDIHKKMAVFAIINQTGVILKRGQISMNQLKQWAESQLTKEDQVVVEATGNCFYAYDVLSPFCGEVVIANTLAMHDRTQARRKTDKVDALGLAMALAKDYVARVWVPSPEIREKREAGSHRHGLVKNLTIIRNRIRGLLHRHGNHFQGRDILAMEAKTFIEESSLPSGTKELLLSDFRMGQVLLEETKIFDQKLAEESLKDDTALKLMSTAGIGPQAALIVTSAIGDIHRFPSPKKLSSYAGLVPTVHQSGETVHYGPITRQGRKLLRWVMIEAANAAVLTPGRLRDRYQHLRRKGKVHNVALVAIARHMLELVWYLLTRNQVFHDARPKYLKTKFRGIIKKAYGSCPRNAATHVVNALMGWTPVTVAV